MSLSCVRCLGSDYLIEILIAFDSKGVSIQLEWKERSNLSCILLGNEDHTHTNEMGGLDYNKYKICFQWKELVNQRIGSTGFSNVSSFSIGAK